MSDLVSIITPIYNGEQYLREAIESVLNQSHTNWELLLINDGSTDRSGDIAHSFRDSRIRCFEQENRGVSAARNLGLAHMKGDFFCFLDADDVLPAHSISSRLQLFIENPEVDYADGVVHYVDENLTPTNKRFVPNFIGKPLNRLLRIDDSCLFGNTWMIRRHDIIIYRFEEEMTHAEDLFFYMSVCHQKEGLYQFTNEAILLYRQNENSAMTNLTGLQRGYEDVLKNIRRYSIGNLMQRAYLRMKITKIMFFSHLFDGKDLKSAIGSLSILLIK